MTKKANNFCTWNQHKAATSLRDKIAIRSAIRDDCGEPQWHVNGHPPRYFKGNYYSSTAVTFLAAYTISPKSKLQSQSQHYLVTTSRFFTRAKMSPNLALVSIPAYFILCGIPHAYALYVANNGDLSHADNRNPRSTTFISGLQSSLPPAQYARYERAEAAHKNGMENMPLYIGAVFAGLIVEQAAVAKVFGLQSAGAAAVSGLSRFVFAWFAVRTLYTIVYINTENNKWSYLRTAIFLVGQGLCFEQFWRAAVVLGT